MNIWCISKYASPPKYGVAARIFYLAKEFVKKQHYTSVITSNSNHLAKYPNTMDAYNYENIDGVNFIWTKNKQYEGTASVKRVLSWFDFEKSLFQFDKTKLKVPDVVIISSLSLLSVGYGYYLKRKYNALLVMEVRDIWPLTLVVEGGVSRYHPFTIFLAFVEKFGYKTADLIVGTMPRLDVHVENVIGYKKPFFCSPLGYDPEVMKSRELSKGSSLTMKFPANKMIVGYAGSMGISNNLDTFIALIESFEKNENIHFMLVGGGDLRISYEARLSNNKNVTFLPKISQDEVPVFLSCCDILYLSTHDSEVWEYGQSMNKVVEYMFAGKPIVASYSGYPSMLNESNAGYFVPPNDQCVLEEVILKLAKMSPENRSVMGGLGRKWIQENRTYEKLASEYLDLLTDMRKADNGE